jgi:hypothetical protein
MKKHTKIYMDFFGYDNSDFIPSELSGKPAQAVHHIKCRGMGGDPKGKKDNIRNLIALTAEEHEEYGDKEQYLEYLQSSHFEYIHKHRFAHLSYLEFISVWSAGIASFARLTK